MEPTPICGLSRSASVLIGSVAYSMAWLAPWSLGWVTVRENLLRPLGSSDALAALPAALEERPELPDMTVGVGTERQQAVPAEHTFEAILATRKAM